MKEVGSVWKIDRDQSLAESGLDCQGFWPKDLPQAICLYSPGAPPAVSGTALRLGAQKVKLAFYALSLSHVSLQFSPHRTW